MVYTRTESEIDKISKSSQIVADTLLMLEEHVKDGIRISKLDHLAEEFIRSCGARPAFKGYMGFPSTLCVSVDNAVVHGIPGDGILKMDKLWALIAGQNSMDILVIMQNPFQSAKSIQPKKKLLDVTKESLERAIDKARVGNFVGDIGYEVQKHAENNGFSVVRELVGHGIGSSLHEEPQIPNFGLQKHGYQLRSGMCIAIEPMINAGSREVLTADDGWTIYTKDGQPSAHFEHTIAITDSGPKILSVGSNG